MRIIITGTKGFIGKNLLNKLKDYSILEINEDIFDHSNWINELHALLNSFDPHVIFHVGACSDTLELNTNYMMIRNYEFTRILSDWSKDQDAKLIYSSSAANYGINNLYPSNLYGWSKYVAEQYVILNGGVALRYFNVYGPGEEHKGKMASVAYQMLTKQKNNEEVKLFPLFPKRDFVYIEDVISANLFAMENYHKLMANYYEVGSGEARTFEDILNTLNISFTYYEEKDIPNGYQFYTCSNKTKWMNGWESNYNLEKGLKEYLEYFKTL